MQAEVETWTSGRGAKSWVWSWSRSAVKYAVQATRPRLTRKHV